MGTKNGGCYRQVVINSGLTVLVEMHCVIIDFQNWNIKLVTLLDMHA